MKSHYLLSILIVAALVASPAAASAAGSTTVTREQVATAIGGAGVQVSPDQIMLLSQVAASTAAALKVDSIEPWGTGRAKARLSCVLSTDCLPFMVVVDLRKQVASGTNTWTANHGSVFPGQIPSNVGASGVRAGSPVVLLLEGTHVHIQITAVSLENGALGQTIRVASKDRKQTFTAVVGEGQIVRGRL